MTTHLRYKFGICLTDGDMIHKIDDDTPFYIDVYN